MRTKNKALRILYVVVVVTVSIVGLMAQNSGTITVSGGAGGSVAKYAIIQHIEGSSADGGIYLTSNQWKSRPLDSILLDQIGVSLVNDTAFTLPSGTYEVDYSTQMVVSGSPEYATSRLYDHTGGNSLHRGQFVITQSSGDESLLMVESTVFTINQTSTISLQHACSYFGALYGDALSISGIWSDGWNVYATVRIKKVN